MNPDLIYSMNNYFLAVAQGLIKHSAIYTLALLHMPTLCTGIINQVNKPDSLRVPYPYMQQLLGLSSEPPLHADLPSLPAELAEITTPLRYSAWQSKLSSHPNKAFAEFILKGIQHGFRIGFNYHYLPKLRSRETNMLSATTNPSVVDAYLSRELAQGRIIMTTDPSSLPRFHCNAFGVIPKNISQANGGLLLTYLPLKATASMTSSTRNFVPYHTYQ